MSVTHEEEATKQENIINILPWYKRYAGDKVEYWYGNGLGTAVFEKCPEPRCRIVNDTYQSDAVLISHNFMAGFIKHFELPVRPDPKQRWIFYSWEAPQHFDIKPEYWHLFNGTFTYMSKSDAHYPYGKIIPMEYKASVSYEDSNWHKKKNVAWIVSNCQTRGGRQQYATELAKHIDVSIYGKCGNNTCPDGQNCRIYLQEHYKFYLSFENSVCLEYATEKLFDVLTKRMIPIVYGLYDYTKNLPSKSFIDVRDFNSPKHLSDYLKLLSSNKTLFDAYFEWKEHFKAKQDFYAQGTCGLCEYLHRTKHDAPRTVRLEEFWGEKENCIPREQFLKSVGVDI